MTDTRDIEMIAHRAGNSADGMRHAETIADLVEVDARHRRGAIEVRHAKRLWPSRRLWERWYLLPRGTTWPEIADMVEAADPTTHLFVDLKGLSRAVSHRVLEALGDRTPVTVASKMPWLLSPFAGREGVRTVRSAGNRLTLLAIMWLPSSPTITGYAVSIDLLGERAARRLRQRRDLLYVWGIEHLADIERAARLGATGVILDDLELVERWRTAE